MENDTQLEEKTYSRPLNKKYGPAEARFQEILSTFFHGFKVDYEFTGDNEKCRGDVRALRLPDCNADLIFEIEVRVTQYDKVLSGEYSTAHVFSRKANGNNTSDLQVSFDVDLKRFYMLSMDVARRLPMGKKRPSGDGEGGKVWQKCVDVPREYIGFFSIDYDNKVIKPELIGPYYTYVKDMWVPIGCRNSNGLATKRVGQQS